MNKYDMTYATVIHTTPTGVIVRLDNGELASAYGGFAKGDRLLVSLSKVFPSGINRVKVDAVVEYAPIGYAA